MPERRGEFQLVLDFLWTSNSKLITNNFPGFLWTNNSRLITNNFT